MYVSSVEHANGTEYHQYPGGEDGCIRFGTQAVSVAALTGNGAKLMVILESLGDVSKLITLRDRVEAWGKLP